MLCYRDRSYCNAEHCQKYKHCKNAYPYAVKEKSQHPDSFVRTLDICVTDMHKRCDDYKAEPQAETWVPM